MAPPPPPPRKTKPKPPGAAIIKPLPKDAKIMGSKVKEENSSDGASHKKPIHKMKELSKSINKEKMISIKKQTTTLEPKINDTASKSADEGEIKNTTKSSSTVIETSYGDIFKKEPRIIKTIVVKDNPPYSDDISNEDLTKKITLTMNENQIKEKGLNNLHTLTQYFKDNLEKRRTSLSNEEKTYMSQQAKKLTSATVQRFRYTEPHIRMHQALELLNEMGEQHAIIGAPEFARTRQRLRQLMLKAHADDRFGDALTEALTSLELSRGFYASKTGQALVGDMALELLIICKTCGLSQQHNEGMPYLMELRFIVENTIRQVMENLTGPGGRRDDDDHHHIDGSKDVIVTESKSRLPDKISGALQGPVLKCENGTLCQVVCELAELCSLFGDHNYADMYYDKYLGLTKVLFGEQSLRAADAYNIVSHYFFRTRRFERSLVDAQKALDIRKIKLGDFWRIPPNPRVADSYCNVGLLLRLTGKPEQALNCFYTALDMRMRLYHNRRNIQPVQDVLLCVGIIQHQLANFREALEIYNECLRFRQQTVGPNHPDTRHVAELLKKLEEDIGIAEQAAFQQNIISSPRGTREGLFVDGIFGPGLITKRARMALLKTTLRPNLDTYRHRGPHWLDSVTARVRALYGEEIRALSVPSTAILPFVFTEIIGPDVLALSAGLDRLGIPEEPHNRSLPVINVPKVEQGELKLKPDGISPYFTADAESLKLFEEWGVPKVEVDMDTGDVKEPKLVPSLPDNIPLTLPLWDPLTKAPMKGLDSKPLMVPNPSIAHFYLTQPLESKKVENVQEKSKLLPKKSLEKESSKTKKLAVLEPSEITKKKEESLPDTKVEIKPKPEISTKPEVKPKPEIGTKPEIVAKPEVKPKPEIATKPEAKPKPEIVAKPEVKPKPEIATKPEAKPKPEIVAKPEVKPKPEIATKPEAKPKPEIVAKPEVKIEAKVKVETELESKATMEKASTGKLPLSKPGIKPSLPPQVKPAVEMKPKPDVQSKQELQLETTKLLKTQLKPKPFVELKKPSPTELKTVSKSKQIPPPKSLKGPEGLLPSFKKIESKTFKEPTDAAQAKTKGRLAPSIEKVEGQAFPKKLPPKNALGAKKIAKDAAKAAGVKLPPGVKPAPLQEIKTKAIPTKGLIAGKKDLLPTDVSKTKLPTKIIEKKIVMKEKTSVLEKKLTVPKQIERTSVLAKEKNVGPFKALKSSTSVKKNQVVKKPIAASPVKQGLDILPVKGGVPKKLVKSLKSNVPTKGIKTSLQKVPSEMIKTSESNVPTKAAKVPKSGVPKKVFTKVPNVGRLRPTDLKYEVTVSTMTIDSYDQDIEEDTYHFDGIDT